MLRRIAISQPVHFPKFPGGAGRGRVGLGGRYTSSQNLKNQCFAKNISFALWCRSVLYFVHGLTGDSFSVPVTELLNWPVQGGRVGDAKLYLVSSIDSQPVHFSKFLGGAFPKT